MFAVFQSQQTCFLPLNDQNLWITFLIAVCKVQPKQAINFLAVDAGINFTLLFTSLDSYLPASKIFASGKMCPHLTGTLIAIKSEL